MKDKRKPGQSQLDYLWVNYADYSVSNVLTEDPDTILTQGAINDLLKEFSGVSSVKVIEQGEDKILEVKNSNGEIATYPFPTNVTITSFKKRQITQEDKNKGCSLPLNAWVYAILLSNGNEYIAPIDKYVGNSSEAIIVDIVENTIYAELKLSERNSIIPLKIQDDGLSADLNISKEGGIAFEKKYDGLSANVVLENTNKFIKFSLLTSEEYSDLVEANLVNDTTMYFIKDAKYFYFGLYKIGGGTSGNVDLDDYYTKREIDNKLNNYATKDYVQAKLDEGINWINV